MRPTRQTQPLRRGARAPSAALTNALRGRTLGGYNPADITSYSAGTYASVAIATRAALPGDPDRPGARTVRSVSL